MFGFFDWVISTVGAVFSFLWQTINGLLRLIGLLPQAVTMLTSSIGYLPSILAAFATATITISVIFIIVGRNSGGEK